MDIEDNNRDIFITNTIYPDAISIFNATYKPIDEIKNDCMVVLDTNALLVPYTITPESLEQIHATYKKLIKAKRLVIPGQVAREFAKNRANKLTELYQQLFQKQNVTNLQKGKYPLLQSFDEYKKMLELEEEIDRKLNEYKEWVKKVLDRIKAWYWNDPVSVMYRNLFTESAIFDPDFNEKDVKEDLDRRYNNKIPPGYKDATKDINNAGDLIIWKTILEIGKINKKSIIFVSGEEKTDWWHKSVSQTLYPRFELIDEFRRHTEGHTFHIRPLAKVNHMAFWTSRL
jgi:hypothetical protein